MNTEDFMKEIESMDSKQLKELIDALELRLFRTFVLEAEDDSEKPQKQGEVK